MSGSGAWWYPGRLAQDVPYDPASMAWQPEWPDFPGRGPKPLVAQGMYESVETPGPQIPPPRLSWYPTYDDFARVRVPLAVAILTLFWFGPIEPPSAPVFDPALFPRGSFPALLEQPPPPTHTGYARPELNPSAIPPPHLSWAPRFPERVPGRTPLVAVGAISRPEINPPAIPPPHLSWGPRFPDRAPGRTPLVAVGAVARPEINPPSIPPPHLSWRSFYADHVRGRAPLVSVGASVRPEIAPAQIPPPPLSWSPTYPTLLRAQAVALAGFSVIGEAPAAAPFDPANGFPWTHQPDFAVGPRQSVQGAHVLPVLVQAPLLSWAPRFPDFVELWSRLVELGGAVGVVAPIVPFDWFSQQPALLPRSLVLDAALPQYVEPPAPAPFVDMSWLPTYPSFLAPLLRIPLVSAVLAGSDFPPTLFSRTIEVTASVSAATMSASVEVTASDVGVGAVEVTASDVDVDVEV